MEITEILLGMNTKFSDEVSALGSKNPACAYQCDSTSGVCLWAKALAAGWFISI